MKRFFIVLFPVLILFLFLFYYRYNSDMCNYSNFNKQIIPIEKNRTLEFDQKSQTYFLYDISPYVNFNEKHSFKKYGAFNLIFGYTGRSQISGGHIKFNVLNNLLYSKDDHSTEYSSYITFEVQDYRDYMDESSHYEIYYTFKEMLNSERLPDDFKLFTVNELESIWEKEGRLPWFPEHVEK